MPLDPTSFRPKYIQVADQLRKAITSGKYQPGDSLPSERDLGYEYEVSTLTARRALGVLKTEGLVTTEAGVRARVRDPGERSVVHLEPGDRVRTRAATPEEQRQFGIGPGVPVSVITSVDGKVRVYPAYEVELEVDEAPSPTSD